MRPYNTLTDLGKARRLRGIVERALTHYPLNIAHVSLLKMEWNGVFRLDAADGSRYVMRVCGPEFEAAERRSEAMWLLALAQESDVPVLEPIKTHEGDVLVMESAPGVPEPRICMVSRWVKGRSAEHLTADYAYQWGSLAARLHIHAARFKPPGGFTRITYTGIFPFHSDKLVIFDQAWQPLIGDDERRDVFQRALHNVEKAIRALFIDTSGLRIIHNDLHPWNIIRCYKHYTVIDFEYCMWGYPVQDAGTSLFYVLDEPNFVELRAAYQEGYTHHLPWVEASEGQLDSMIVARAIYLYNLTLQYGDTEEYAVFEDYTIRTEQLLRRYLDTGKVI